MPTHPFFGRKLAIERVERDMRGARYITVKHPSDGLLRLPIEWTDRVAADEPPTANGEALKAGIRQLLLLAEACAAAEKNLDICQLKQSLEDKPASHSGTKDGSKRSESVPNGRAKPRPGKRVGDSGAQVPSKGMRRGEKR